MRGGAPILAASGRNGRDGPAKEIARAPPSTWLGACLLLRGRRLRLGGGGLFAVGGALRLGLRLSGGWSSTLRRRWRGRGGRGGTRVVALGTEQIAEERPDAARARRG